MDRRPGIAVVVVRLVGVGQLLDIRVPAHARLLAVVPVPRARIDTALRVRALARVRNEPRLDLALAGSLSGAHGHQVLNLLQRGTRGTSAEPDSPATPSGLHADAAGADSVTVGWQPGAAGSFTSASTSTTVSPGSTTTPSWRFDALVCETAYQVSVEAEDRREGFEPGPR